MIFPPHCCISDEFSYVVSLLAQPFRTFGSSYERKFSINYVRTCNNKRDASLILIQNLFLNFTCTIRFTAGSVIAFKMLIPFPTEDELHIFRTIIPLMHSK